MTARDEFWRGPAAQRSVKSIWMIYMESLTAAVVEMIWAGAEQREENF